MKIATAVAVACLSIVGLAAGPDARAVMRHYELNIPKQSLDMALRDLAQQTGLQIALFSDSIDGNAVVGPILGNQSAEEALKTLLTPSGLSYKVVSEGTIAVLNPKDAPPAVSAPREEGTKRSFFDRFRISQATSPSSSPSPSSGEGAQRADGDGRDLSSQEDKSLKVEEIVVTARKISERLQDVPSPVTVVNTQQLTENGQLQLQNYYTKVPGLSLVMDTESRPVVVIRGITTGGLTSPSVGTVVDDVPFGYTIAPSVGPSVADIDPADLARIEVLRGPQGTLYGASSLGGLLKYVTVDPSIQAMSSRIQVGMESISQSNHPGYTARGSVNLPLSDNFAVRASGFTLRNPGYVDNVQSGENDYNRRDSEGGRVAALWRPSDALSVKLSALIQNNKLHGSTEVTQPPGPDALRRSSTPGTDIYNRYTRAFSATVNGRLGVVDLTSLSGYTVDDNEINPDFTLELGLPGSVPEEQRARKFSQEFRASVPLGERLNWDAGLFFTDEDFVDDFGIVLLDPATGAPTTAFDDVFGSVNGVLGEFHTPTNYKEYAAFTNLLIELSDRFDIQLGGRFSRHEVTLSNESSGPFSFVSEAAPKTDANDSAFTYLVTPRFRITPELMAYARVASGYRPGGPNLNCQRFPGLIPCQFGPDTTTNYELGLKGSVFDRRLSLDLSVYYIDWKDIQLQLIPPTTNISTIFQANAGSARSQGVEFSLNVYPRQGMTVSAWVAVGEAELTEDFPDNSSGFIARRGAKLPYSSPLSGSISLQQEFPLGSAMTARVGSSVSYVGKRKDVFQDEATVRRTFPAYFPLDFNAALSRGSWTLNAYVNNVPDKRAVLRGGLDPSGRPTDEVVYVQPRTIGMSLSKDF